MFPLTKVFTRAVFALAFAAYQTAYIASAAAAPIAVNEELDLTDPDYYAFTVAVGDYHWEKGMATLGLTFDKGVRLIELEYDVLNHPGKPKDFSFVDLGAVGCLPGKDGKNPLPGGCHALFRDEEDDINPCCKLEP